MQNHGNNIGTIVLVEQFKASIQEGVDQLMPGTTCLNPSVGWPLEGMGDVEGSSDKVVYGGMDLVDGAQGWPLEGMVDVGGSGDKVVCGGMALVDGA